MSDDQLKKKLITARDHAFTPYEKQSAEALLATLDWHQPWVFYRQVFAPTYIGDVMIGVGCRACGPGEGVNGPCAPLRAVFDAMGIAPDPRSELDTLAPHMGRADVIDMNDVPPEYRAQLYTLGR